MSSAPRDVEVSESELVGALRLRLSGLGTLDCARVQTHLGGHEALASATLDDLVDCGLPRAAARAIAGVPAAELERERELSSALGLQLVARGHPTYPRLLHAIPDPPCILWVKGRWPPVSPLAVAVIGPRRPSAYGLAIGRQLAGGLAELGLLILSGGARGVDGCAHDAALRAGGETVAILGCGVDVTYPREHTDLFRRIAESGAVVSEHPCGTPPLDYHFPARNRLLAGWAQVVVVAEASLRSGTLITARLAVAMDRDVLAVPGPVTSPLSEGTNALIKDGAGLARDAADVVAALNADDQKLVVDRVAGLAATRPEVAEEPVLAALVPGCSLTVDEIAVATGLPAAVILVRLVQLETAGKVVRAWGGRHARA